MFVVAVALLLLPAMRANAEPNEAVTASIATTDRQEVSDGETDLLRLPAIESSTESVRVLKLQLAEEVEELHRQIDNVERRLAWAEQVESTSNVDEPIEKPKTLEGVAQAGYQSGSMPVDRQYWGGVNQHSRSHYPTIAWGGFLQLDTGWISQDAASRAAFGEVDAKTGLRRVRLNVRGNVQPNLSYLIDVDFAAAGHPSFRDVMFTAHDLDVIQNVRLGYYQQPFGLDAITSGRELIFLERFLPFAFDPFRQTGFGCYGNAVEKTVAWALSAYRFPTDEFGVSEGESGGWALASRTTAKLIDNNGGDQMVHVGLNYAAGNPGTNMVRYAIEPGFFVTDPTDSDSSTVPMIADTGDIPTEAFNLFGAELAAQYYSLNFQSEVKGSVVDQTGGPHGRVLGSLRAALLGAYWRSASLRRRARNLPTS